MRQKIKNKKRWVLIVTFIISFSFLFQPIQAANETENHTSNVTEVEMQTETEQIPDETELRKELANSYIRLEKKYQEEKERSQYIIGILIFVIIALIFALVGVVYLSQKKLKRMQYMVRKRMQTSLPNQNKTRSDDRQSEKRIASQEKIELQNQRIVPQEKAELQNQRIVPQEKIELQNQRIISQEKTELQKQRIIPQEKGLRKPELKQTAQGEIVKNLQHTNIQKERRRNEEVQKERRQNETLQSEKLKTERVQKEKQLQKKKKRTQIKSEISRNGLEVFDFNDED